MLPFFTVLLTSRESLDILILSLSSTMTPVTTPVGDTPSLLSDIIKASQESTAQESNALPTQAGSTLPGDT
jgi:hypothetical protein